MKFLRILALALAPSRAEVRTVDFIIAGVQKGGTTALGNHLRQCSPDVCLTEGEWHALDRLTHATTPKGVPNGELGCKKTSKSAVFGLEDPLYMYIFDQEHARALNRAYPGVKLIILLRSELRP